MGVKTWQIWVLAFFGCLRGTGGRERSRTATRAQVDVSEQHGSAGITSTHVKPIKCHCFGHKITHSPSRSLVDEVLVMRISDAPGWVCESFCDQNSDISLVLHEWR